MRVSELESIFAKRTSFFGSRSFLSKSFLFCSPCFFFHIHRFLIHSLSGWFVFFFPFPSALCSVSCNWEEQKGTGEKRPVCVYVRKLCSALMKDTKPKKKYAILARQRSQVRKIQCVAQIRTEKKCVRKKKCVVFFACFGVHGIGFFGPENFDLLTKISQSGIWSS